jgi:hypothetical protein
MTKVEVSNNVVLHIQVAGERAAWLSKFYYCLYLEIAVSLSWVAEV